MTTAIKTSPSSRGTRKINTIRTFRSAVNYLNSVVNYERKPPIGHAESAFNLSRMQRLLAVLGNPHRKYKTAHVAGTKGKGSTVTMLAAMVQNCGMKVGLYTSPHVLDIRERIAINGDQISEAEFARLTKKVVAASKKPKVGDCTFFELVTAVAFLHFAKSEVDLAVIETGLGGRLDATNVIKPEVVGLTSISLDHPDLLGHTVEAIAREKAGIFKPGVTVICSPQRESVTKILQEMAAKLECPFQMTGRENGFSYRFESSRDAGPHSRICLTTPTSHFEHVRAPLMGDHQAINCALALGMLDVLKTRGLAIDERKAVEGLSRVTLPGRMEIVRDMPRIMVDGAHNASSVEALMRAIGQNVPYDSMVIIFGCQKDKDIRGMLRYVRLGADKVIFTTSGSPRTADPHELAATFNEMSSKMCQVAEDLMDAISIADRAVARDDLICITGSFYLVGRAKRLMRKLALAN